MKTRIQWIDVLKCIGIFEVYLGHYGTDAGAGVPFVFTHHVALFFWVSGAMENLHSRSLRDNFIHSLKTIIAPLAIFVLLDTTIRTFSEGLELSALPEVLMQLARGAIRNEIFAGGLWFLTCLFVVRLFFAPLQKIKNKFLILLISAVLFIAGHVLLLGETPTILRLYNVDSALVYLFYYVIGYLLFPLVNKVLISSDLLHKTLVGLFGFLAFIYAALVYFGENSLTLLLVHSDAWIANRLIELVQALIIIWFWIVVSYMLREVKLFNAIGKNTLYLCGGEYIIQNLLYSFIVCFGGSFNFGTTLRTYLYVVCTLCLANYALVPILKFLTQKLLNYITTLFKCIQKYSFLIK